MSTTANTSATETLADLGRHLDLWEQNLRANFDHYMNTGRDPKLFANGIQNELNLIDSIRDIVTPGWSAA